MAEHPAVNRRVAGSSPAMSVFLIERRNERWDYVVDKMTSAVVSKLTTTNKTMIGAINELNSKQQNKDVDYYDGDYTVTPKVEKQELATRQKFLTEDVKIKEIPFFEVSNNEGGQTVFIGKEL